MESPQDDVSVDEPSSATSKQKSGSKSKLETSSKSKQESGPKPKKSRSDSGGGILALLGDTAGSGEADTTAQHGSHVFDQNCDICTGKVISPPPVLTPTEESSVPEPSPEAEPMDTGTK